MQSKITSVEPKGTWSNGQRTFNKYQVSFANGDSLGFLAVGDFKKNVGDVVTYDKNEEYQTGKLVYEQPAAASSQTSRTTNAPKDDVQKYIIRQSMLKAAVILYSKDDNWDEEKIKGTAKIFENYVYNG
jgi:hypothetical protein